MPQQDLGAVLVYKGVRTDTATTDAGLLTIPFTGKGYAVRRVTVYNSRLITTDATANNATTTFGVFTAAAGAGQGIVATAALTNITSNTVVEDRTVAAVGVTPLVTAAILYLRVTTASGVANSAIDVAVEVSTLP